MKCEIISVRNLCLVGFNSQCQNKENNKNNGDRQNSLTSISLTSTGARFFFSIFSPTQNLTLYFSSFARFFSSCCSYNGDDDDCYCVGCVQFISTNKNHLGRYFSFRSICCCFVLHITILRDFHTLKLKSNYIYYLGAK